MDVHKLIAELNAELETLHRVIGCLEQLRGGNSETLEPRKQRGRKSMTTAERLEVAERMKEYWANRRRASRISGKR
jgi:hypothetical protein